MRRNNDFQTEEIVMKIHLFWIDKNWKRNGGVANNYNLIVDMENKRIKCS